MLSTPKTARARTRGRPPEFDRAVALDAALETFWLRGFKGASLDDLTSAMDLNRASLYCAFGNKANLYSASVDHYIATIGQTYLAPLFANASIAAAFEGFYEAVIDGVTGKHGSRGCIVACTLPAEAGVSTTARDHLAAVLAQLDAALLARLTAAQRAGEIPSTRDVRVLAQVATSGMLALSIRARAGATRPRLRELAREFVGFIAGA